MNKSDQIPMRTLTRENLTRDFFADMMYCEILCYDYSGSCIFLNAKGEFYSLSDEKLFKRLEKIFPALLNKDKNWTKFYLEMGGGCVIVNNAVLAAYDAKTGISSYPMPLDRKAALETVLNLPPIQTNDLDFSKGLPISTSDEARRKAREFSRTFPDKKTFWQCLKDMGFVWRGENSDPKIVDMWAHNALAAAIDGGFVPKLPASITHSKISVKDV